jgi:hypothetical protein
MATNSNSPFGFHRIGVSNASVPTFGLSRYRIAYNNSGAIYYGDPVEWVVNTPTGYIKQAAASDISTTTYAETIVGIFYGCTYISIAQKRQVWSNYWPGSDAVTNTDVTAYVCDDPSARFQVMTNSSAFTASSAAPPAYLGTSAIGQYAAFTIGSGSTSTGLSGAYLSGVGATATTYPFLVLDYVTTPPGAVGTDPTGLYCWVVCGFNTQALRGNAATTGIS